MTFKRIFKSVLFTAVLIIVKANKVHTGTTTESTVTSTAQIQNQINVSPASSPFKRSTVTIQKPDGKVSEQLQDGEVTFGSRIAVQKSSIRSGDLQLRNSDLSTKAPPETNSYKIMSENDAKIPEINDALKLVAELETVSTITSLDHMQTPQPYITLSSKTEPLATTPDMETQLTTTTTVAKSALKPIKELAAAIRQNRHNNKIEMETVLFVREKHPNQANFLKQTSTTTQPQQQNTSFKIKQTHRNVTDLQYSNALFPQYISSKEDEKTDGGTTISSGEISESWHSKEAINATTEVPNDETISIHLLNRNEGVIDNDIKFSEKTSINAYKVYGEANPDKTDERLLDIQTKAEGFESPIRLFRSEEVERTNPELQDSVASVALNENLAANNTNRHSKESIAVENSNDSVEDIISFTSRPFDKKKTRSLTTVSNSPAITNAIKEADKTKNSIKSVGSDKNSAAQSLKVVPVVIPLETANWTLDSVSFEEKSDGKVGVLREVKKESSTVDVNGTLQLARTMTDEIIATFSYFDSNNETSGLYKNETAAIDNSNSTGVVTSLSAQKTTKNGEDKHLVDGSVKVAENASSGGVTENLRLNLITDEINDVGYEKFMENDEGSGEDDINSYVPLETSSIKQIQDQGVYENRQGLVRRRKFRRLTPKTLWNKTPPTVEGVVGLASSATTAKVEKQKLEDADNDYICLNRNSPERFTASSEGVFAKLPLITVRGTTRRKWQPYQMDCNTEEDEKGEFCVEWARSGLCTTHRPTMFLFCRKTCLCTGPPDY